MMNCSSLVNEREIYGHVISKPTKKARHYDPSSAGTILKNRIGHDGELGGIMNVRSFLIAKRTTKHSFYVTI